MSVKAMRRSVLSGAMVLLGFTGVARAQPPSDTLPQDPNPPDATPPPEQPEVVHPNWVDNPYAPHVTNGNLLRFGTAVGPITTDQRDYTAIGAVIALGRRVGRFTFELEYDYLGLQDPGPSSLILGRAQNVALVARVDVLRLGPSVVGANSMLAIYAEGAIQRTMFHYYYPGITDAPREVPDGGGQSQAVVGFGALLDHRLEQPLGFPSRVGWQLGWRLASSPRDQHDPMLLCTGCVQDQSSSMPMPRVYDTELIVTSTLNFTW